MRYRSSLKLLNHETCRGFAVVSILGVTAIACSFSENARAQALVTNYIYTVQSDGHLGWYADNVQYIGSKPKSIDNKKLWQAATPGCAADPTVKLGWNHCWSGPFSIGSGWTQFASIIPAWAGPLDNGRSLAVYAIRPDGDLMWLRHDGLELGSDKWVGPFKIGVGWAAYKSVFGGGDGIIYGITPTGELKWSRNYEASQDNPAWKGPVDVTPAGDRIWAAYRHVLYAGGGVIYAIKSDGTLVWYRHKTYEDGVDTGSLQPEWDGPKSVGSGWAQFSQVFSPGDGHIYAVRPDGKVFWYLHRGHLTGASQWESNTGVWVNNLFGRPRIVFTATRNKAP